MIAGPPRRLLDSPVTGPWSPIEKSEYFTVRIRSNTLYNHRMCGHITDQTSRPHLLVFLLTHYWQLARTSDPVPSRYPCTLTLVT